MFKSQKKALVFLFASLAVVNSYSIPSRENSFTQKIADDVKTNSGLAYGSGSVNIKGCEAISCIAG